MVNRMNILLSTKRIFLFYIFISFLGLLGSCDNEDETSLENELNQIIEFSLTINKINGTSADILCAISNTNDYTINEYGLCWNNAGTPSVNDLKKEGEELNNSSFSVEITDLNASSTYFIKAYLVIEGITIYSEQIELITTNGIPSVRTIAFSDVTLNSAKIVGEIIDDGGFALTNYGVCWSKGNNPTLDDDYTSKVGSKSTFITSLNSLSVNTTYYVRSFATNTSGTAYGNELIFTTYKLNAVTDIDENYYNVVTIGDQTWMAENLKVTHYPDGRKIPLITDSSTWSHLGNNNTDDAYCYYDNDTNSLYGALYTYAAAMGACPDGWHLPSEREWRELVEYIKNDGYSDQVGNSLKSTEGWYDEGNGSDVYGFNALPGGNRDSHNGSFQSSGDFGYWRNSKELWDTLSSVHSLSYATKNINWGYHKKSEGMSVRCVKDIKHLIQ